MALRERDNQRDRRLVLLAFGSTSNLVVLGIVVLAVLSRPIPQVLEMLAITLASQLGGAMIALGFRPTDPPRIDRPSEG